MVKCGVYYGTALVSLSKQAVVEVTRITYQLLFQDISGSVQEDDIDRYIGQKNYNISVPENANCSFTVCYEETTNDYFLMRGTTATCHTALTRK